MLTFLSLKWDAKGGGGEPFRFSFFAFNQGSEIPKVASDICGGYGEGVIAERNACDTYAKFKNGNFSLKDVARPGRPAQFDGERLNQL
ncbi:histone-lysine N-methyltransferase SETMAR [Trichonephila clavata]|uniref:Histone-lysine N-methyltransferase SETMAR n=1 Tax=Trichonephila clavata TaxID=2740835 RepID=A0A8X6LKC7_TRICU|nr:histone-lysine N-methyltransferase SETMAR [Trichonephila clavata]